MNMRWRDPDVFERLVEYHQRTEAFDRSLPGQEVRGEWAVLPPLNHESTRHAAKVWRELFGSAASMLPPRVRDEAIAEADRRLGLE